MHKSAAVRIFGILVALLLFTGPGFGQSADVSEYRLASGDQVKITVYGHEDLSGVFEIDGSGEISLPLIREIVAAKLTAGELEERIIAALKPDYLKHPRVSVEVMNYRPYYIIGEVTSPGSYPYVNGMNVINAVAVAGGFTYRARKGRITIKRTLDDETVEIKAKPETPVLPGDVIQVPERFF